MLVEDTIYEIHTNYIHMDMYIYVQIEKCVNFSRSFSTVYYLGQDEAPAHYHLPNGWVERIDPTEYPACSPDQSTPE